MNKISLTLKITLAFVGVSMLVLVFLYYVFSNLFQERMLEAEKDKATIIAKTLELDIGTFHSILDDTDNYKEQVVELSNKTIENYDLNALTVIVDGKAIFSSPDDKGRENIHINYPIKDRISNKNVGSIDISYKLNDFYQAFDDVRIKIIDYLALLAIAFLIFAMITRRLLSPLGQIAKKVKDYQPGSVIEFSSIRTEPETNAIIDAFGKMLSNIREYTVLLERYKYAVDESAIVSKTDKFGIITYVNDEFCRTSGYSKEEVIGKSHNIVRHPEMHKETFANLWKTLHENKAWKGMIKNRAKDGSAYYVKVTIVPIFDENAQTVEYIAIDHDITQIVRQQEQIARQTTDLITGLPNRIKLEEDLKGFASPKFALVALDNYNIIKDYYGYDIGNYTLKETAEMLQAYMKERNVKIYKLASGEFGLLIGDNTDVKIFYDICNDVLKKIDDFIININENSFSLEAIAGLSYSKKDIVRNASLALSYAKKTRKPSLVYEETNNITDQYKNNLVWTKRLKSALLEERIIVYVQPIVNAKTLATEKYECLVRMLGEEGEVISPYFFLDVAKKTKLYHQLTERVIRSAFEVFSTLPDKAFSINFSVEDLTHTETMDFLKEKIKEYDLASRLVLEIVESEGIENFNEIIPLLSELKALGCQIAIDDFGTGYSNFAYLMQLNVDYIKIDGSLIKSIDHDLNSQIISRTILDFAQQLELKTVAEFIHNETVMLYTQNMGIDYLQGFHLGEPVPIKTLLEKED